MDNKIEISKEFSRMIYEDGIDAYHNSDHPCHHFVDNQTKIDISSFQLPEPFSGKVSELGIVFLSLNPSINKHETFPTVNPLIGFNDYDKFFRNRFHNLPRNENNKLRVPLKKGKPDVATLWNKIEKFGTEYLGSIAKGRFILGQHALLIHSICYKSKDGWLGDADQEQAALDHHKKFMKVLFKELEGVIIVALGNQAIKAVKNVLFFNEYFPDKVTQATGTTYYGWTDPGFTGIKFPVLAMQHRAPSDKEKSEVAKLIIEEYNKRS